MKLYRIFIPKYYNDETKIEIGKIRKITDQIKDRFGSYSMNPFARLPLIEGVWTSDKTGKTYTEQMFMAELFLEDTFKNKSWLKAFREIVKQELKQEEIFIIVQDAEIII